MRPHQLASRSSAAAEEQLTKSSPRAPSYATVAASNQSLAGALGVQLQAVPQSHYASGTAGNQAMAAALRSRDGRGLGDDECDARPWAVQTEALDGGVPGGAPGGAAAPVPIAVRNGPGHTPIDTSAAAGMAIDITLTSSSGVDADMAAVQDSEQVSVSFNHTGSYAALPPGRSNNSGYMPGYPVPADRHSEPKAQIIDLADNHGGAGSMSRSQLDTFTAPDAGITVPQAIPDSGYLIERIIIPGSAQGELRFRLEKSPQACTVNGFTTTAGPSPMQSEEVLVRPASMGDFPTPQQDPANPSAMG